MRSSITSRNSPRVSGSAPSADSAAALLRITRISRKNFRHSDHSCPGHPVWSSLCTTCMSATTNLGARRTHRLCPQEYTGRPPAIPCPSTPPHLSWTATERAHPQLAQALLLILIYFSRFLSNRRAWGHPLETRTVARSGRICRPDRLAFKFPDKALRWCFDCGYGRRGVGLGLMTSRRSTSRPAVIRFDVMKGRYGRGHDDSGTDRLEVPPGSR
ncbi:hypothetical protein BH11ACT7_BH11ACT7_11620 [soil metagenome]